MGQPRPYTCLKSFFDDDGQVKHVKGLNETLDKEIDAVNKEIKAVNKEV